MELTRAAVLVFLLAAGSPAQDTQLPPLETVVEPTAKPTKRIIFLVDRSGSMEGLAFTLALKETLAAIRQGTDEMQFAVVAFPAGEFFGDAPSRWPGIPEPENDVPPGWAALPSEEAAKVAEAFLTGSPVAGGTPLLPALRIALAEPRDELTIAIISDCVFNEQVEEIGQAYRTGQAERERAGYGRATLIVLHIGGAPDADSFVDKQLKTFVEIGNPFAGLFRSKPNYDAKPVQTAPQAPPKDPNAHGR